MQTLANKIWERFSHNMWQGVYDKGFVDALDKGASLDEACEAGDQRVLEVFSEWSNPDLDDQYLP